MVVTLHFYSYHHHADVRSRIESAPNPNPNPNLVNEESWGPESEKEGEEERKPKKTDLTWKSIIDKCSDDAD